MTWHNMHIFTFNWCSKISAQQHLGGWRLVSSINCKYVYAGWAVFKKSNFFISTHYILNFFSMFSINYSTIFYIILFYMFMFSNTNIIFYLNFHIDTFLDIYMLYTSIIKLNQNKKQSKRPPHHATRFLLTTQLPPSYFQNITFSTIVVHVVMCHLLHQITRHS